MFNLLEQGIKSTDISVIAEYLPGDESINYTSPYAGGNFSCITGDDAETLEFDRYTYTNLHKVQAKLGGSKCGLDRYISTEYWDLMPSPAKKDSLKEYLEEYEDIPANDLPKGVAYGIKFRSWNFNCPLFLLNFQAFLENENGVKFTRKRISHVSDAYSSNTETVFNCTGIGAHKLGGVSDSNVYPTRGQVVVIKAPHIKENVMRWTDSDPTYIIKRPYSNDQLILGGYTQKDNWTADTFKKETVEILEKTTKLFPKILEENPNGPNIKDLEILRVASGLRPSRHGGPRIEKEVMNRNRVLIHNYGASGYGYQAGFAMGHKAVRLALSRDVKL